MDQLNISMFVSRNGMILNRRCLNYDDPDQIYNYIKSTYNVDPEDYGIQKPFPSDEHLNELTKEQLIKVIQEMRCHIEQL